MPYLARIASFAVAALSALTAPAADRTSSASLTQFSISVLDLTPKDCDDAGFSFSNGLTNYVATAGFVDASPILVRTDFTGGFANQRHYRDTPAAGLTVEQRRGADSLVVSGQSRDGAGQNYSVMVQSIDPFFTIKPNTRLTFSALASASRDLDPDCAATGTCFALSYAQMRFGTGLESRSAGVYLSFDGSGPPLQHSVSEPVEFSFSTGATAQSGVLDLTVLAGVNPIGSCRPPRFNLF